MDVSFFVPFYNESGNAVPTIEMIVGCADARKISYEILAFDDASTDGCGEEVERYVAGHPGSPVTLIRNKANAGLGRNYLSGARIAKGEHYMMVCGDNDTPRETLDFILDHKGKADMIIPYLMNLGERPLGRRVFSRLFTALVGSISGSYLEYYNGIVLHKTATVLRFAPLSAGFAYQAEILCQAVAAGLSYVEIPIRTKPQLGFFLTSAFRLPNILSVLRGLWIILSHRRYHCAWNKRKRNFLSYVGRIR